MDARDQEMVEKLVAACYAQVERGHFEEMYEGFNDCPAWRYGYVEELGRRDMNLNIDRCDCGIKEALDALDVAAERGWFTPEEGWDREVRPHR